MNEDGATRVASSFTDEVAGRFGVLPSFFCTASAAPGLIQELWSFAKSAYLDSPLPSLFKERLFVHLSRFCEVRYCIVRHVGFLIGKGWPAGDLAAVPETIEAAITLLSRPVPDAAALGAALSRLEGCQEPIDIPAPRTQEEADLFDALTIMFVEPGQSARARDAVRRAVGEAHFEILAAYLAFVRTAHYWTETHPEIAYEPDMLAVMARHETLARLLLDRTEAERVQARGKLRQTLEELLHTRSALRRSEERYRLALEALQEHICELDVDTRVVVWSPGIIALIGEAPETFPPTVEAWLERIHPEDMPRFVAARDRVFRYGGERFEVEYRVRHRDGHWLWLWQRSIGVRDETGRLVHMIGSVLDVSARHEAEAALGESEARFHTIADAMPQIVWSARADGHHDYYNRRWYEYTGLSREQTERQNWPAVMHPDDVARTQERWGHSLRTGKVYEIEYRLRGTNGAYRWFITRGLPIRETRDAEHSVGRVVRWYGTCTDIEDIVQAREVLTRSREELAALVEARTAELLAAEATLRQAQKMEAVGQLTGGIAHDFNNMLQGIAGSLDLLGCRIEQGRPADARRWLERARDSVERAAGLTQRLLAFARRQRLEPKPINPDRLVVNMADLVRRTIGPGVILELKLPAGAETVLCDPNELENAILNLCINARDAMPDGGRLSIGTENVVLAAADGVREDVKPGAYVAISIADIGIGMPPDVLEQAFEPFFTTKPTGEGTGLGLSQVYGFVRQSGGVVHLESEPGRGTTVRLFLPRHEQAEQARERSTPAALERTGTGATVLLVDDEIGVREPAAERLREQGYRVLEAADGPSVLRLRQGGAEVDLLVTDVGLPHGMNGRQVAEVVRERWPGAPVLFITGYATAKLPPGAEVIGKPFELDDLTQRVRELLVMRRDGGASS